jgi:hypothetical protein
MTALPPPSANDGARKNLPRLPATAVLAALDNDCPACGGKDVLDTGWECNVCNFDAMPIIFFHEQCEARGERMHPSGLYESEITGARS